MELKRKLGIKTSILVVVASMIGTGIFITTGTVLSMTMDASTILILWGVGGVVALTGALCYAELATMWPHVGGEYVYLRNTFGLLPSFLTGWISLVVGFSASIATSAITFVKYLNEFWHNVLVAQGKTGVLLADPWSQKIAAAVIIFFFGAIHIHGVESGSKIQNVLTVLKLLVVISLLGFGFYFADWSQAGRLVADYSATSNAPSPGIPQIGLVLLIIMFSFSGWNGASYIAGEIKNPEKNLPKALFLGTLITVVLYILLNVLFLLSTPGEVLMGKEAVGAIATNHLFGSKMSNAFTFGILLILLSSISVQMMIGPRVYYAMAKDKMLFKFLSRINPKFHTPSISIIVQIILTVVYVFIGNPGKLMEYLGFALSIFPVLTVIGLIYLRIKRPDIPRPYKVPLYPLIPLIFIILSIGMMIAGFMAWTATAKFAIAIVILGIPVYYLWRWFAHKRHPEDDIAV